MRARELGIRVGDLSPGPQNAITDVEGVRVGHSTIVRGDGPLVVGEGPVRILRYHSPGFDDLPAHERTNLVVDACAYVNRLLEALRKLVTFLEHGEMNFRGPAALKVAGREVEAAVLRDVDGLTNREIGERLGVPLPTDFRIKADHPTVRKRVGRGRKALKAALGEEGWKVQVRVMQAKAESWRSTDLNTNI
jgi:hypothetical protein